MTAATTDDSTAITVETTRLSLLERCICYLATVVGCATVVYWWWGRHSLWEDEIIAITHANQPLPSFFIEVLRNDIHPPLYFLQLKLWRDIGFGADAGLLLNSMVWAMLSLVTLFLITRTVYGKRAALYATAVFAILPMFAYGATNLRMYGLVPGLALLVWYVNRQWFLRDKKTVRSLSLVVLLELVLAYMHAIAFFFVAFIALAALLDVLWQRRAPGTVGSLAAPARDPKIGTWLLSQIFAGICMLPLVGSGIVRGSDASAPASFFAMLTAPGSLIAGWGPDGITSVRVAGLLIFLVLAAAGLRNRSTRMLVAVVPVGALLVAIVISMGFKPMFKTPVFAANLLPFLALGAGVGAAACNASWLRRGVLACLLLLCVAALPLARYQATTDAYLRAGQYMNRHAQAGDVVVIPSVSVYWGVMRYVVGGDWGQPLAIMPLQHNPQWRSLIEKMGPKVATALHLYPQTDQVVHAGVTYVIGPDATRQTVAAKRVWLINKDNYPVDAVLGTAFTRRSVIKPVQGDVLVSFFEADPAGSTTAQHPFNAAKSKNIDIPVDQ